MSRDIFVDTSGWLELVDPRQPFHKQTEKLVRDVVSSGCLLVTTHLVMIELVALMLSPIRLPKERQIEIIRDLERDPTVDIVFIDQPNTLHAWHLWENREDKFWTLTDCSSFLVMQDRGLTEALTTDHHFEQAGFIRLLK